MRNISVFLVILLLGASHVLFAQNGVVKGRVTDKDTHQPLRGASILIDSLSKGVVTNDRGEFILPNIPNGKHLLSISYTGYASQMRSITGGKTFPFVNIELKTSVSELTEVVITGTGTPHYLKSAPVQTEVFSQKALDSFGAGSVESLLAGLSSSFTFSSNAMGTFMRLNGLGNEYILVLLNGRRLYGDVGSQNDLSRIDPATIERVEIVKGASSSLYGSDAIAGVVNIITKRSSSPFVASNVTRVGSYGEWLQSNTVGVSKGKLQLTTTFNRKQQDGWQNSRFEIDRKGTPSNPSDDVLVPTFTLTKNPTTSISIKQGISHQVTSRLSVNADADLSYRKVSPPIRAKGYQFLYHNQSYAVGAKYLLKGNGHVSVDATYDRFRYLYQYDMKYNVNQINSKGEAQFITYYPGDRSLNNDQQKMTVNGRLVYRPNTVHSVVAGIEGEMEWMEAPFRLKEGMVNGYMAAVYVQDEVAFSSKLVATVGGRMLHHSEFGQKFTPKISLMYRMGDFNLRGTYASGFKTPTLKELNYRYEREDMGAYRLYLGNPKLKPQTSNYYSAAVEYNAKVVVASVAAYSNCLNDMIEYRAIATSREDAERGVEETKQYGNIANARILGVDALLNLKLGKHWLLGGGYSYTDGVNLTESCRLKGSALHSVNVKCLWQTAWPKYKFNVGLFGDALTRQYGDALSENYYDRQAADGYMLWRVNTVHGFTLSRRLKAEAACGVENILDYKEDKPYGSSYGTTTPGRTYYLSLTLRFAN